MAVGLKGLKTIPLGRIRMDLSYCALVGVMEDVGLILCFLSSLMR